MVIKLIWIIMEQKINIVEQLFGLISRKSQSGSINLVYLNCLGQHLRCSYCIGCVCLCLTPGKIFEAYQTWYDKVHADKIEKTIESHYQIHGHLTDLRYKSGAMRAMILSLHNGSENINGRYQFLKVSAIFEECGDLLPCI